MIRLIPQIICPPVPRKGLRQSVLAALLVLLCAWPAGAQQLEVLTQLKLDRKEPKPLWFEYVPADGGLVTLSYMSRRSSREIGLYKYNANFDRSWRKPIYENNRRTDIQYLAVVGEVIYIFTTYKNPTEDVHELSLYTYDLSGKPLGKPQIIHQQAVNRGDYDVRFEKSLNKRKLLVYIDRNTRAESELVDYFVFGTTGHIDDKGTLRIPYADDRFEIQQISISNLGELYAMGRNTRSGRVRDPKDVTFHLFYKTTRNDSLYEYKVSSKTQYITDLKFKIDRDGNAILGGFFSNKGPSQVGGTLYGNIAVDTRFPIRSAELEYRAFDNEFLKRYIRPRQLERGEELRDFYLDKLILRSDGGMLMLAEEYYVQQSTFRNMNGMWITQRIYHYNDIMIASVSPVGDIEWLTALPKMQSDDDPQELSYAAFVGATGLHVFYKSRERGTGSNIFVRKVGIAGDMGLPQPFFERYRTNDIFYRGACEQISNSSGLLVYYQAKGKLFTMLKVGF